VTLTDQTLTVTDGHKSVMIPLDHPLEQMSDVALLVLVRALRHEWNNAQRAGEVTRLGKAFRPDDGVATT
jgi:hypothetical protein